MRTPSFVVDLDRLPAVLTLPEFGAVYRISLSTIRRRLRLGTCAPWPSFDGPYRWNREDVIADLKRPRRAPPPKPRKRPAKATLDRSAPARAVRWSPLPGSTPVKWFQLDSDMPDDPKIRAVVRALGVEGLGGLVAVWCHVAKHGHKPGQGIDARGAPLPIEDLVDASHLPDEKFTALIDVCTRTGHFRRDAWERHRGIWIPAMERRADRYTRKVTRGEQLEIDWRGP